MKMFLTSRPALALLLSLVFCTTSCKKELAPATAALPAETGVSLALAEYRKAAISQLSYALELQIPAEKAAPIAASERITFTLHHNEQPLQLDFKEESSLLHQLEVNGQLLPLDHRQEHIHIPTQALQPGTNTIDIRFTAGNLSLNRNEDYLYTLLVPDRARTLFPVFDQPNLKASFSLSLTVPEHWQALANGPLQDSTLHKGQKTYHFAPSDTISTYLFSFAAGRFEKLSRQVAGRSMHFYHRETDADKLRLSLNPIFQLHADALQFMEEYTGIPYPFQKFDFIALPDFQYGGMEHVGAIDYKASTLFLDAGATKDQEIGRANLIAHETAHMWFGDLVTMDWFNDVWMKEVFANFMADKISQQSLEGSNYGLKFLISHTPAAYGVDRTQGANPIRQPLENLQEAGSLYGAIIYHKAPIMMRQLERLMGEEALRQGLREYLSTYAYGNASWPQLIDILDAVTPLDLKAWNQVWVNEPGRPVFDWELRSSGDRITELLISQKAESGPDRLWPQYFDVALVYADTVLHYPVQMNQPQLRLKTIEGAKKPLYVLFNASGEGYGVFPVDTRNPATPFGLSDPVARASAYINLYENMLNGRSVAPRQLLDLYRSGLRQESEELNLKLLTEQMSDLYWRLLPAAERQALAPQLEEELWQAMRDNKDPNAKKLLFKAYQSMALSTEAKNRLYTLWESEKAPVGVVLTEDDYTALALALVLREYPAPSPILERQISRIPNPDRKKRLQFLSPALSKKAADRDAFFASLRDAANREKEAWVATALGYLHHPLRQETSRHYLLQSLELLEEIQQTGDIFFPYAWLQATFGAYTRPEADRLVRSFLEERPQYNPRLRAKILQAADGLFRAQQLLEAQNKP
ncbi:M1 family metallopeptidase [Cesiribacter andamanensis]|uniref:Aminopeptidase N n=1 Tax=Cesiribacter andamanensis AMV16 TaxID=1279009 RepID=M7N4U4_9BACT|nr:M1 family aminopeptidase [Cesiribacter andamanensis]EMR02307.1 Aminopeptidase N [Cesiribacter andamanensis AMV16]